MGKSIKRLALIGALICTASRLFSADISIPELELITRGSWSDTEESVLLTTRGMSTMTISGGYKFSGSMSFGFESGNLDYAGENPPLREDYINDTEYIQALSLYMDHRTSLDFLGAEVLYRDIGGEGTDLTYFVGQNDRIATGEDFVHRFGTLPFATKYQGYFYFPQHNYRGLHRINGTGLKLASSFGTESHLSALYFYEDAHPGLDPGTYSGDYRALFHFDKIQLEYFAGTTFPRSDYGLYRTGMLLFYQPTERGSFFAQVGIPWWEPLETLNIEHFYFLFEPRVHFDPLSVILTLFWHPEYYRMEHTGDSGNADIHFNFLIGSPSEDPVTGGLETKLEINTNNANQDFGVITTPYLQAVAGGVMWNFSVNVRLLPYSLDTLVEGVVGIKAEF